MTRIALLAAVDTGRDRFGSVILAAPCAGIAIEQAKGLLIGDVAGLPNILQSLSDFPYGCALPLDQRLVLWKRLPVLGAEVGQRGAAQHPGVERLRKQVAAGSHREQPLDNFGSTWDHKPLPPR